MYAMARSGGSGSAFPPFAVAACFEQLAKARAADVLHDDVAVAAVLHEVDDLHDVRMVDGREEPQLRDREPQRVGVAAVEHALEHDPLVVDAPVAREVDPAEPSVRDATDDFVLPADEVARDERGRERERRARTSGRTPRCVRACRRWPRPTGSPSLAQKRFDSETLGSVSTAAAGSGRGIGSISTRPAPSRWRGDVVLVVLVR